MKKAAFKKRVMNSAPSRFLISLLLSLVLRFIHGTARIDHHYHRSAEPYIRGEKPAVFCFWHGRMILHPFVTPPGRKMFVLVSNHNDGSVITAVMQRFGIGSVRGSRRKGGSAALRELFKVTENHDNISITPDGPRGPFQVAAQGAAFVAAKTGYPLVPISFSSSRHYRFRSWDRFMLPKPFAYVAYVAGKPIHVPADSSEEQITQFTQILNDAVTAVTDEADRHCGVGA